MSTTGTAERSTWYSSFETSARESEIARNETYLSFRLADNDFGIKIAFVIEVVAMKTITELPQMPVYIKGVADYRGNIILVVDLRIYLDLPPRSPDDCGFIVVIDYRGEPVGLIVDEVHGVRGAKREELIPVRSRYGKNKEAGQKKY